MPALVTDYVWLNLLIFVAGLYILTKSSDKFVDASVFIARRFNISEMVIGLTLVSIGTSLPELATNIYSSLMPGGGGAGIAIGNVAGSNICNILLGLALTVIILKKVDIHPEIFKRDILTMLGTFALFGFFCYYGFGKENTFTQLESGIIFLIFISYTWYLIKHVPKDKMEALEEEMGSDDDEAESSFLSINTLLGALTWVVISIIFIVLGAQMMVDNIVDMAVKFNIPNSIIAATIIAIGTSLPEIAVSLSGVKQGKPDIAIGNVIGSCIFNLALVMGVSGMLKAVPIDNETKIFLLPAMLLTGLFTAIFMRSNWCLRRWEGIILVLAYVTYLGISVYKIL